MAKISGEVFYQGQIYYLDENYNLYKCRDLKQLLHPERFDSKDFLPVEVSDCDLETMLKDAIVSKI